MCTVAPPDPPSNVRVTNIQPHSVDLMWDTQSGVASYTVQYTKTQGHSQHGECKSETHSGSVSTTDASTNITVQGSGNDMLRAFTTYSITVTAASVTSLLGSSAPSTAVVVTTAQTGIYWYVVYVVGYCVYCINTVSIVVGYLLCSIYIYMYLVY